MAWRGGGKMGGTDEKRVWWGEPGKNDEIPPNFFFCLSGPYRCVSSINNARPVGKKDRLVCLRTTYYIKFKEVSAWKLMMANPPPKTSNRTVWSFFINQTFPVHTIRLLQLFQFFSLVLFWSFFFLRKGKEKKTPPPPSPLLSWQLMHLVSPTHTHG